MRLQERLSDLDSADRRPANLWPLVVVYLVCGVVLLALALIGAVGSGPIG